VKLLLDTNAYIRARVDPAALRSETRAAIRDANDVLVSVICGWEIETKQAIGKLDWSEPFLSGLIEAGYAPLPVMPEHVERLRGLPLHHKDPFDRMLVAQALHEDAILVTADAALARYGVKLMAA
jgi:PIN domain nuclease of toxin-antitoxin system